MRAHKKNNKYPAAFNKKINWKNGWKRPYFAKFRSTSGRKWLLASLDLDPDLHHPSTLIIEKKRVFRLFFLTPVRHPDQRLAVPKGSTRKKKKRTGQIGINSVWQKNLGGKGNEMGGAGQQEQDERTASRAGPVQRNKVHIFDPPGKLSKKNGWETRR